MRTRWRRPASALGCDIAAVGYRSLGAYDFLDDGLHGLVGGPQPGQDVWPAAARAVEERGPFPLGEGVGREVVDLVLLDDVPRLDADLPAPGDRDSHRALGVASEQSTPRISGT
ncbi:hypothetical protein ACFWFI_02500 [Streptomyces sp. NPDC060209]|uniref:hypothetical protein n=1 Tax=Streptomyces sp. NPDC060209 TaxID=3347073 RepID=UPI00365629C8